MYDVFGDESCGPLVVTYALVAIPEQQIPAIEKILRDVKEKFGGQDHWPLHCRELFGPSGRAKTVWSNLSLDEVFALYAGLFAGVGKLGVRQIVAVALKNDFPPTVLSGEMQHIDPSVVGPLPWTKEYPLGDKQLAAHCAQGTMIPLSKSPGLQNIRFYADPDRTPMVWIDGKKRQATRAIGGFIDVEHGEPPQVNVMAFDGKKSKLLEFADALAYVSQRVALAKHSPNDRRFRTLSQTMNPVVVRFKVGTDGGFGFSVPNTPV
jgi:hypothetical protein